MHPHTARRFTIVSKFARSEIPQNFRMQPCPVNLLRNFTSEQAISQDFQSFSLEWAQCQTFCQASFSILPIEGLNLQTLLTDNRQEHRCVLL